MRKTINIKGIGKVKLRATQNLAGFRVGIETKDGKETEKQSIKIKASTAAEALNMVIETIKKGIAPEKENKGKKALVKKTEKKEMPPVLKKDLPLPKPKKKTGIIASIIDVLETGPATIDVIHAVLIKRFPEKDFAGMRKTILCQIGGKKDKCRLEREKGIKVVKNGDKFYIEK